MKQFRHDLRQWLAVFVLLLAGTVAANAYDKPIVDGTQQDGRLPIYGIVANNYQQCEYVIPKELLEDLKGTTINGLTYKVKAVAKRLYLGECKVFLKEVDFIGYDEKKFSGIDDPSQVLYTGELNAMGSEMSVSFNTPFKYTGKNLLIGFYVTDISKIDPGASVSFLGTKTDYYTGITSYTTSIPADFDSRAELVKFLPAVTFSVDNTPHDVTYNSHDGKVTMSFTGLDSHNQAVVGKAITATVTDVANGYVIDNVRDDYGATINDNGGGVYSFEMPDNWVYINSDLKRDISIEVYVTDPLPLAENEPLRFASNGNVAFVLTDKLADKDDQTKWYVLTNADYEVTVTDKKTGDTYTDLADVKGKTGAYTATFKGIGNYINQFAVDFNVQEMYEVELDGNYYGTQFYADAIETFDDPNHEMLATVTKVEGTNVTITALNESKVAKNYPFLIYNPTNAKKTFKLWKAIEDVTPANPTPAAEYTGTAANKTFTAADMTAGKDFFVLQNGKEFVYVLNAGTIKAHRCWIEVANGSSARILTITADATGISDVKAAAEADGIYDMQGRRLEGMPTQRGLYVIDGRKVVVK